MLEPVLAPNTHIGIRENGDAKKPSHTGTRKHARFTPVIKVPRRSEYLQEYVVSHIIILIDVHHSFTISHSSLPP